ncbi:MAG: hypothetical protein P9X27_00085 [Candidatus Kaelpia aquatica]|nr:hypothetical protein [Candidatus Kaelpia aquatica]
MNKKKDFLKELIFGLITVSICCMFSADVNAYGGSGEEEPMGVSSPSSAAEVYADAVALSLAELESREENIRSLLIGKKSGEQVRSSYQNLSASLQMIAYTRNRTREFEKMRIDQFFAPIKAAGPSRSVGKNGAISFNGTNAEIAKRLIEKYATQQKGVTDKDIEEALKRIAETSGQHEKKKFSITFNHSISNDKLGGPDTLIPIQVALRDEEKHFMDWTFSKTSRPTYAQDDDNPEIEFVVYKDSYNYVKNLENAGQWWGVNNKESNAFGYVVKLYQEIENLETGVITNFYQNVLEMDFNLRETRSYHRKVTESLLGEYTRSYEETVDIKEFYLSVNEDGDIEYMPQVLEITRFNDDQSPDLITTSLQYYQYDEFDRASEILSVSHIESKDGTVSYNTISISKILEYDPLTKLATIESVNFSLTLGEGSLEDAIQYGQVMWRAFQDEEVARILGDITSEKFANAVQEITEQVINQGMDYEAARTNVLAQYWSASDNNNLQVQNAPVFYPEAIDI